MADSSSASGAASAASQRNARIGLWLFWIYFLVYAGFMAIAAFSPTTLGTILPIGPNLAIVYGFGLIAGALVLACVYMVLCAQREGSQK